MDSYFGKEFRDQLHDLNRTGSEHDLPSIYCCQKKENVETLSDVKYVPDILDSIDSTALESAKENEIIPLDIKEKIHKTPHLPDKEVRTAVAEDFADNFCDGPLTFSCSLNHSNDENNKSSTTDCLLETCLGYNINFRKELKSVSFPPPCGRTRLRTDVSFQPMFSESFSTDFNGRQNKDEVTPVTPPTLLRSDELHKYSNTEGNIKEILVLRKQSNDEDAPSRRQQVCYFR